jgi:hypothetical protein
MLRGISFVLNSRLSQAPVLVEANAIWMAATERISRRQQPKETRTAIEIFEVWMLSDPPPTF